MLLNGTFNCNHLMPVTLNGHPGIYYIYVYTNASRERGTEDRCIGFVFVAQRGTSSGGFPKRRREAPNVGCVLANWIQRDLWPATARCAAKGKRRESAILSRCRARFPRDCRPDETLINVFTGPINVSGIARKFGTARRAALIASTRVRWISPLIVRLRTKETQLRGASIITTKFARKDLVKSRLKDEFYRCALYCGFERPNLDKLCSIAHCATRYARRIRLSFFSASASRAIFLPRRFTAAIKSRRAL